MNWNVGWMGYGARVVETSGGSAYRERCGEADCFVYGDAYILRPYLVFYTYLLLPLFFEK